MRFLLYNIRYGTGGPRFMFPWSGYFRRTGPNLQRIIQFIASQNPDIAGLVEVDAGSFRSRKQNQARCIAEALGHYHVYRSKYSESGFARFLPIVNKQGNAFLARDTVCNEQFHYFDKGVKRLVIELETDTVTVFLVHLALNFRVRHRQMGDLYSLVKGTEKPHIVAGDFNAFWGDREIKLFLAATGLASAAPAGTATYPSWAPRRQLDFILHSPDIEVAGFSAPRITYSDHLPLVCDFNVRA
jgi:endonuclease/exonuclease/phosphatase family metal-dependent hydrolase